MERSKTYPFLLPGILLGIVLLPLSCAKEHSRVSGTGENGDSGDSGRSAVISLSVRAASTSLNADTGGWEDRVSEIRMLAFDGTGKAVFNRMLRFPNGFDRPCEGVSLVPGTYTFCFIANETAPAGDFAAALASVSDISQLDTDPRFTNLVYDPGFVPDGTTGAGRFLMSAIYDNVVIGRGGSIRAPVPLPLPTGGVELVRALARVEIVFRKKEAGGTVPQAGTIASVRLQNVAADFSVPPCDYYYTGAYTASNTLVPSEFDYARDSIGSALFYIPELLRPDGATDYTEIVINGLVYPLQTDAGFHGLAAQRRTIASLSEYSVVRNYNYTINAYIDTEGGIQLTTSVVPWRTASYTYIFEDPDQKLVIPPVDVTPHGIVIPSSCGKVEIMAVNETLSSGLQGVYGDQINWWDPVIQGPDIVPGKPPYYCEKKYGAGWRLINSCELMSFLSMFDQAYRIWQSNTWQGINSGLPFYPAEFRRQAQGLLEQLTGTDLSACKPTDSAVDDFGGMKLGIIDDFFTPGDVVFSVNDFPGGWPFPTPPENGIEPWFPMETVTQVKAYWYSGYLNYSDPANYDAILYERFTRYNFSSTISRCVRSVE